MRRSTIGSGTTVTLGLIGLATTLLLFGRMAGWAPTWRAFGVTPLQPSFFDMHVIIDYAACANKGLDPYAPHACNIDNFNIPPTWLWAGYLGVDGADSSLLSIAIILAAAVVVIFLFRRRSWFHGIVSLTTLSSPPVMMGVERGNLDLLILALVGSAALIYNERKIGRAGGAVALLGIGVALKLFPMFCVVVAARFSRQSFIFACAIAAFSLTYVCFTFKYILLIRRNVPTTFDLSYGYKVIFLGIDHIREEAGLGPIGLANSWVPLSAALVVLICAAAVAADSFHRRREFCSIDPTSAGTAFLFGSGIYCGTYLLGTNFVYRLMFLLLCLPQIQDWLIRRCEAVNLANTIELGLLCAVLGVLWSNGSADGDSTFLLLPQLLDWLLFFMLTAVLMLNALRTLVGSKGAMLHRPS